MELTNYFRLWYENEDGSNDVFIIKTVLSKKQFEDIVKQKNKMMEDGDGDFDTDIIKRLALVKDPNYEELKIENVEF